MNMHWGKTLGSKRHKIFKPRPTTGNRGPSAGGFHYNATEYRHSREKVLWDKIWDEAMNHTLANRTSPHSQNVYAQKTRLHDDVVVSREASPHSFAIVMVISSMFLFFTVAVMVAVVVFCRRKNVVFALQKSEQQDEGEYELDDMDTDVDDDPDDDLESGSPTRKVPQKGEYSQVNDTAECIDSSDDTPKKTRGEDIHSTAGLREELKRMAQLSPIYKPKRPLRVGDNRGAYQAISVNSTPQRDICCVPSNDRSSTDTLDTSGRDNSASGIPTPDSPFNTRSGKSKASLLCVRKSKNLGISCVGDNGDTYEGAILAVSVDNEDKDVNELSTNNITFTMSNECCHGNYKGLSNGILTATAQCESCSCTPGAITHPQEQVRSNNGPIANHHPITQHDSHKYDTEISIVADNVDIVNSPSQLSREKAVVRLAGKSGDLEIGANLREKPNNNQRNSSRVQDAIGKNNRVSEIEDKADESKYRDSHKLQSSSADSTITVRVSSIASPPRHDKDGGSTHQSATHPLLLPISTSPGQGHTTTGKHCQKPGADTYGEEERTEYKQLRQQWVIFDDTAH